MEVLRQGVQQVFGGGERFSLSVDVERQAKRDGYGGKEWMSPDGTRRISIDINGGRRYGGVWMKDIHLLAIGEMKYGIGGGELMRVQEVIEADGTVEHNVYLDVTIDKKEGKWPTMADAIYSSRDGGKLYPFSSWSGEVKRGEYEEMPDEEFEALCLAEVTRNGILHESELPAYIDIDATIAQFVAQVKRRDFSKPVLVAREPSVEEIAQIEENARLRQEAEKAKKEKREAQEKAFQNRREVVLFKSVVRGVESVLPSGIERKRGTKFADRFVSIKPQLMEMHCEVHIAGSREEDTVMLRVDKDHDKAVKALLKETGIKIKKEDAWLRDAARWSALGSMAGHGLLNAEDLFKEARIKEYVIYESNHLAYEDALRVNLNPEEEKSINVNEEQ